MEREKKIIPILIGKERIVEMDFRDPRHRSHDDIFDAWLGCCRHGNCVPITAEAGRNPQDVDLCDRVRRSQATLSNRRSVSHRIYPPS